MRSKKILKWSSLEWQELREEAKKNEGVRERIQDLSESESTKTQKTTEGE
jgi:hypothetical protein